MPELDKDHLLRDVLEVAEAYREWIMAVPSQVADNLPSMPGIDGDFAQETLDNARKALNLQTQHHHPYSEA